MRVLFWGSALIVSDDFYEFYQDIHCWPISLYTLLIKETKIVLR